MARPYVEDTDLAVTFLLEAVGRVEDVPRREEMVFDLGGALVARVITRRGPMVVVVDGFEAAGTGWRFMLVAVFDGRRGSCETAVDSWMAGSFLGRSWSSSPELVAFRFRLAITGKDEDEDRAEDGKEIAGGPTPTFSWSVCSLGKRDILTFARLRRRTTPRLNPSRDLTWSCDHRNPLTCLSPATMSEAAPTPEPEPYQAKFKVCHDKMCSDLS